MPIAGKHQPRGGRRGVGGGGRGSAPSGRPRVFFFFFFSFNLCRQTHAGLEIARGNSYL